MENQKTTLAKTLMTLDNAIGVSGDETEVAAILRREMEGLYDDYEQDLLGNQLFIRRGKNPDKRVMLAAHMDEIGFIINHIEDGGFARLCPVGYHDDRMCVNQDLVFITADGKKIHAVTGSKPAHIMTAADYEKVIKIPEVFADFGTSSAAETRALGIEIGDCGTFNRQGYFLNGTPCYTGKAVDDRAGLAVLVEAARRLKGLDIEPTVCFAGTVQEEVGMRSGGPIGSRFKPELMFAVDGTLTGGIPDVELRQCSALMGGGVGIKFFDWDPDLTQAGSNVPRKLTNHMIAIAKKHNIPYQREVFIGGGTDAWSVAMSGEGVLTGGICIPMRYVHTAVGIVRMDDLEHTVDFIIKYLQEYVSL